jgi:hypothetical protein
MADTKLAPNLPGWMVEHANRNLSSGGADGHMYTITRPRAYRNDSALAAADDDRPEVGREVRVPAVLWESR